MKKTILYIAVIAVIITFIFLSNNKDKEIKATLGVIGPFSGEAASLGEGLQKSLLLAPHENIDIQFEDDQCNPKNALTAYNLLREREVSIFYVACSGSVLAIAPLAQEDGVLILTGYAGSIGIRETGDEVIRFIPDGLSVAQIMLEDLKSEGDKQYGILYEQQDYASSVRQYLVDSLGEKIIVDEGYLADAVSYKSHILKFVESGVDGIIIIPVDDVAIATIYKEMNDLGVEIPIIGEVNVCDKSIKPEDSGLRGWCYKAEQNSEGYNTFIAKYKELYGAEPQYPFYDAASYDIVYVLNELFKNDPNQTTEQIQLEILDGVDASIASYSFDKNGEIVNADDYLRRVDF